MEMYDKIGSVDHDMFIGFNIIFRKMVNNFKPLYAIAYYWLGEFEGLTGDVADNYEELKKIYDEKYAWKPGYFGVTEQHYEIIEIEINNRISNYFKVKDEVKE